MKVTTRGDSLTKDAPKNMLSWLPESPVARGGHHYLAVESTGYLLTVASAVSLGAERSVKAKTKVESEAGGRSRIYKRSIFMPFCNSDYPQRKSMDVHVVVAADGIRRSLLMEFVGRCWMTRS